MFEYFDSQSVRRLVYYSYIYIEKTLRTAETEKLVVVFTGRVSTDTYGL